jgi:hypothetical protein
MTPRPATRPWFVEGVGTTEVRALMVPAEYGAVYLWDSMKAMEKLRNSELSGSIPVVYRIIDQPRTEVLGLAYTLRPEKESK